MPINTGEVALQEAREARDFLPAGPNTRGHAVIGQRGSEPTTAEPLEESERLERRDVGPDRLVFHPDLPGEERRGELAPGGPAIEAVDDVPHVFHAGREDRHGHRLHDMASREAADRGAVHVTAAPCRVPTHAPARDRARAA